MRNLRWDEFQDRIEALARARKIFIPHITKSITTAFELYQEVLAEGRRKVALETKAEGNRTRRFMDDFIRPRCPECGAELYLRIIDIGICPHTGRQSPANAKGWRSCWLCEKGDCIYEAYSKKTLKDWVKELPLKEVDNA
jgi:hypothetical protein